MCIEFFYYKCYDGIPRKSWQATPGQNHTFKPAPMSTPQCKWIHDRISCYQNALLQLLRFDSAGWNLLIGGNIFYLPISYQGMGHYSIVKMDLYLVITAVATQLSGGGSIPLKGFAVRQRHH